MHLLQLPQHVLQAIVANAINASLPHEAWLLRLVCKQFNREVLHAVFDKDDTTLLDAIIRRETPFYSDVGRFRCLRGFILRHNHENQPLALWEQLDAAVNVLADHVPNSTTLHVTKQGLSSPNRFLGICSDDTEVASRENAMAMICDALLSFLGNDISSRDLLNRDWYDMYSSWENLQDKQPEFWLLMVAARRNDLDLCHIALEKFRVRKNDLSSRVWLDNLADALRIPAHRGSIEMVELILAQEGVQVEHILKRGRHRGYNSIELAAMASQFEMVRHLLSRGVDILQDPRKYAMSFSLALHNSNEASTRREFIELFMSLTDEWRSNDNTAGIIYSLCRHGDLEGVKMVVEKFEAAGGSQLQYQWRWVDFSQPNDILVKASKSGNSNLVKYIIENRKQFPSLLEDSFADMKIVESIEMSIEDKQLEVLTELLDQCLPTSITMEKLLVYAAMTGDVQTLELLRKDVDLDQKFDDESTFWDFHGDNSRLNEHMFRVFSHTPSYKAERGLFSLGTICLIFAIKAANVDVARWYLENGYRLGRRYIEQSRWLHVRHCALISEDETLLGGKGAVFGITWNMRFPISMKKMAENGDYLLDSTILVTRGRSKHQIQAARDKGRKETKFTRFLDKFRFNFYRASKVLADDDTRVIYATQVNAQVYNFNEEEDDQPDSQWSQMYDLLWDYKHPNIYI